MIIRQGAAGDAARFRSANSLHFVGQDNTILVQLSGIVVVDYQARESAGEERGWARQTLSLELELPQLGGGDQAFQVSQCVPFITLNGIGGVATVGWGVNAFAGPCDVLCRGSYSLEATLSVYNSGEVLHTIGYMVSLVGQLRDG